MIKHLSLLAVLVLAASAFALSATAELRRDKSESAQGGNVIAIRGVTLVDGTGRSPVPGVTVVIEGTRIRDVGTTVQVPSGARVIEGANKFLIPGMIDAHIHLRGGRGAGSAQSAADQE